MEKNTVTIEITNKNNDVIKTIENQSVGIFLNHFNIDYGYTTSWKLTVVTNNNEKIQVIIKRDPITLDSTINCLNI